MTGVLIQIHETKIRNEDDYKLAVETRKRLIDIRKGRRSIASEAEIVILSAQIQAWDSVIEAYVESKKNREVQSSTGHRTAWAHD